MLGRLEDDNVVLSAGDRPDCRITLAPTGEAEVVLPGPSGSVAPLVPPERVAGERLVWAVPNPANGDSYEAVGPNGERFPARGGEEPVTETHFDEVLAGFAGPRDSLLAKRPV